MTTDYEKRYNEALERARKALSEIPLESYGARKIIIDAFPELAESEDEKIRKGLIDIFNTALGQDFLQRKAGLNEKEVIAYLEKQKEQKPAENEKVEMTEFEQSVYDLCPVLGIEEAKATASDLLELAKQALLKTGKVVLSSNYPEGCSFEDGFHLGYTEGFNAKQEQKPAEWSEEDEKIRKALVWHLKADVDFVSNGVTKAECLAYLDKQKAQKQEWSEEDKRILKGIIGLIDHNQHYNVSNKEMLEWLKSLRPQSQGTYKLIIHNIYNMLKDKDFFEIRPPHLVSLLNDIRVKCKDADECATILDEPSWKPSEGQMSMLLAVIRDPNNAGSESCHLALESLYDDLKKL